MKARTGGFVLPMTILLILGVSAISIGTLYNARMGRMSAINYKKKIQTFMASDGLVTLLSQELINGNGRKYVDSSRLGRIDGELWTGVNGDDVGTFEDLTRSDPIPDQTIYSYYLGSSLNQDLYGVKWKGWIIPPLSGAYTFITRSDDESRFYLSTDQEERNLSSRPICKQEPGWVYAWPRTGDAVSGPIPMVGGRRYYFEYYHKEGWGFDVGQVGWNGPEFFSERPITGKYLSRYKSDPAWAGTTKVGDLPVRYQVAGTGLDAFRIFTEAINIRPGTPSDTSYRLPLTQAISLKGAAVTPPNKLFMRVMYHDFLAKSHPEFNPAAYDDGVKKDMVQHRLTDFTARDAAWFDRTTIPKPTRYLSSNNYGCGVDKWFKEWTYDNRDYRYDDPADCSKTKWNFSGDTYRHPIFYDSLEFTLDLNEGPSTYVFSRMGNYWTGDPQTSWRGDPSEFFPLDWRGQDPNPGAAGGHNFGFCMELHTTFIYQSGMKFEFTGDDDTWVFINDEMVIDLGGIHPARNDILNLDDLTNLRFGTQYNFDFFQCERHEDRSSSRIVTNIKMIPPKGEPVANWRRDYGSMD